MIYKTVVDFHTHVFPTRLAKLAVYNLKNRIQANAFFDGTVDGLIENMKENGVSYSVCLPIVTVPKHTKTINDFAFEINQKCKNIISFGGVHPLDPSYQEVIDELVRKGFVGIKIHPVSQELEIDDERYINLIDYAIEKGLYVLIHAGLDPGYIGDVKASVEKLVHMLDRVKNTSKIILAHMGGLFEWNQVMDNIIGRDLYLDTAMSFNYLIHNDGRKEKLIEKDLFIEMVKKHGSDRILFGSDNPWTPVHESIDYIDALPLSNEEKENILYKNALKILGETINE